MGHIAKTVSHHVVSAGGHAVNEGLKHEAGKIADKIVSSGSDVPDEEEFAMPNKINSIIHTAHITLNGKKYTFSLLTNEAGQALNDVVVADKTIIQKGEQIFS